MVILAVCALNYANIYPKNEQAVCRKYPVLTECYHITEWGDLHDFPRRYRKGYRVPNVRGDHFAGLTKGLYGLLSKQDPDITEEEISESLKKLIDKSYGIDYDTFIDKLKQLLRGFEISNNELGRRLNYDPSYISRILSGQRRPADIRKFNANVAYYIAHQKADELEPSTICEVLGCDGKVVEDRDRLQEEVENWLSS